MFQNFTKKEILQTLAGSLGMITLSYFLAVGFFLLFK